MTLDTTHQPASVTAVATTEEGHVLLQLRDEKPRIEYPGHWSLLAGWIEPGENPLLALKRELHEELQVIEGGSLHLGDFTFLGCVNRTDRPWMEYVFHVPVLNDTESLRIREGRELQDFEFDACLDLQKLAPHHREHIRRYSNRISHGNLRSLGNRLEVSQRTTKGVDDMHPAEEYVEVSQLGLVKDYEALEVGDGYVVPTTNLPTAALHPKVDACFLALLIFAKDTPRGNHYHLRKVEHMVVLRGRLLCAFALPEEPTNKFEVLLEAGQMVRILPGCVHTFTAQGEDVYALEYAPQRYEAADVLLIDDDVA